MYGPFSFLNFCMEPEWFVGEPTSLARGNIITYLVNERSSAESLSGKGVQQGTVLRIHISHYVITTYKLIYGGTDETHSS